MDENASLKDMLNTSPIATSTNRSLWGYTQVKQVSIDSSYDIKKTAEKLLDTPHLADDSLEFGHLWLVETPTKGYGLQAKTEYVAFCTYEQNDDFMEKILFGPHSLLLMPDLIAHKGYHQIRQYQFIHSGDSIKTHTNKIRDIIGQLLQTTNYTDASTIEIAQSYDPLIESLPYLEGLQISLERMLHNYTWWRERFSNDIVEYHYSALETASCELELLVTEVKGTLEVTHTAIELREDRHNKLHELWRRRIETLIIGIGLILAIPQWITLDVVGSLSCWVPVLITSNQPDPCSTLSLFIWQCVLLIIVGLVVMLVLDRIRRR
jgi:hypothetical protein